jgi:hypothetical protein
VSAVALDVAGDDEYVTAGGVPKTQRRRSDPVPKALALSGG